MTDPSLVQRKQSPSGCALLALTVVVFAVLVVGLYWVWSVRCDQQLARQFEEIRSQGEPVTPEELEEFYAIPERADDTTELWLAATRLLDTDAFSADAEPFPIVGMADYEIPGVEETWEQIDEVEAFLGRYRNVIQTMHTASRRGGAARYPATFTDGLFMSMDSISRIRNGARLLKLDLRLQSHRGNVPAALESLHGIVRIGESLEFEPILVSQLVRASIAGIAVYEASSVLTELQLSEIQLEQLQKLFSDLKFDEGAKRGVLGERVIGSSYLQRPASNADIQESPWLLLVKQDGSVYLRLLDQAADAMMMPYPQAKEELQTMAKEVAGLSSPRQLMARMLLPSMEGFCDAKTLADVRCLMAEVGIAIKRFELANERLPNKLQDLVPEFLTEAPLDLFDLQPLRYVIGDDDKGFYLYSVGRDGIDSGGVGAEEGADHVFTVGVERKENSE